MHVVLACDTLDRTNWGCRATSSALRALLAEAGASTLTPIDYRAFRHRAYPGFRFVDAAKPVDAALRVRAPGVRIGDGHLVQRARALLQWGASSVPGPGAALEPRSVDDLDATWRRWQRSDIVRDWVDALERCDVFVMNGEGAVRPASACGQFGFFLAWVAKARLGKPVAIVNHMCDLTNPVMRAFAEVVYPLADHVVVRGSASCEVAAPLCRPGAVAIAPDAAFRHEPAPRDAWLAVAGRPGYHAIYPGSMVGFDPAQPYVCVGGSASYQDGQSIDQGTVDWFTELAGAVAGKVQVVLCGHDYPDHTLFSEVAGRLGLPFVGVQAPVPQLVDLLGHASAYLGGRWHSAVLASTGGTPVLALASNSGVKSRDQRDFVVVPTPTFSLTDLPPVDDVLSELWSVLDAEEGLRAAGLARTAGYRDAAAAHAGLVAGRLEYSVRRCG